MQIIQKLQDKPSFLTQEKFSKIILHPYVNYKLLINNGYLVNSIISLAVISPLKVCKIERFLSKTKVVGIPVQLNCDKTMSDSASSNIFLYVILLSLINSLPFKAESSTRIPMTVIFDCSEIFNNSSTSF